MWQTIHVRRGDVLSFGIVKQGARAYLAVAGGIDVPEIMDSRSTYTLCGVGGYEGVRLKREMSSRSAREEAKGGRRDPDSI